MSSYKCFEEKQFELKPVNFSMLFPGIEAITLTHSLHYKLLMSRITLTLNYVKEKKV